MITKPLTVEEQGLKKATHVTEISALVDFAGTPGAGNTLTLSPVNIGDKMGAEVVAIEMPEAFVSSDGSLTSTSITIGDGNLATRFLSATELNVAGTEVFLKGGTLANTGLPFVYTVDDTVDVFVTATAAKVLSTHTAGKLKIYWRITDARVGFN